MRALALTIGLALLGSTGFVATAQTHPFPGPATAPPVICVPCGNLPTYPFSAPIVAHRGRYVDSTAVRLLQSPIRTYRAERVAIVPERDRIYMKIGSTFASYRLSTFFARDLDGPMISLVANRDPAEAYLPFLSYVYPEKQSEWVTVFQDGQERLGQLFDWDDRGYVYLPLTIFGWGIVQDVGGELRYVKQWGGPLGGEGSDVGPLGMISIKHEGKYYVYVFDTYAPQGSLFDVTTPSAPVFLRHLTHNIASFAKATVGGSQVIGYADSATGEIRIFGAGAFLNGRSPERVIAASPGLKFWAIAADDASFYGAEGAVGAPGNLAVISASGSVQSYEASRHPIPGVRFQPSSVTVSAGVVTAVGYGDAGNAVHLWRLGSGTPEYLDFKGFFQKYYSGTAENGTTYAGARECHVPYTGVFWKEKGREYVVYAAGGLGDVYEIRPGDGIGIERDAMGGTANPYSAGSAGPFYGDVFRFRTASSGEPAPIEIDYGNPEAASGNVASGLTGQTFSYQYSGLDSAAKISSPRTVTIKATADPSKTASVGITMSVPTARVRGWRSGGGPDDDVLFAQSNATAAAPLVVGDSLVDASDGSVESHVASWALDGRPPVVQAPDAPFPAGACGTHSLAFKAIYGANQNVSPLTTPDYTIDLSNLRYTVQPFAPRIAVASAEETAVRFRADVRVGANVIVGGAGAAATFRWELRDRANTTVRTSQVTAALGGPAEFSVAAADLANAKSVVVEVSLSDAAAIVGPACAGMASAVHEVPLLVPDPVLSVTGCSTPGNACSVTAASASGQNQSGWTYAWFLNDVQKATTNVASYSPSPADIAQPGTYRVKVRARNERGMSAESPVATFTLQAPACTTIPDAAISFTWSGADGCSPGACTSNSVIRFNPRASGYAFQDCDRFHWSLGDNTSSVAKYPQHKYPADGTYSVTLTVINDQTPGGRSATHLVSLGSPAPSCEAPSPNIAVKAAGSTSGCTGAPGAPCAAGEIVSLTAVNSPATKPFQSCDRFEWSFGDGTSSQQQNPTKSWAAPGTYAVTLEVANSANPAGVTVSLPISVAAGECKAPTDRAVIEFSAPSGCSGASGSPPCKAGEIVTLNLKTPGTFQACDTFDWDFGDGTTLPGSKIATVQHQFPPSKSEYSVSVTIRNPGGSVKATQIVRIDPAGEEPKSVDFSVTPSMPRAGAAVTFTATAPAALAITTWEWDFGDGSSASGNPVQHTFGTDGARNVTLRATPATGTAVTVVKEVRVLKLNEFAYLLPVVSHLDGANGSKWRTDLEIYNANAASGPVALEMELTSEKIRKTFILDVATLIYEDFMSFFTSANAAGPVMIRGSAPHDLQIWTRTYSVGASSEGTFGHLIPAIRIDGQQVLAAAPATLYLTGLNLTPKYRTNVYLLNITDRNLAATITAYEGQFGSAVGQLSREVAPFQLTPLSGGEIPGAPTTAPFSIAVQASPGLIVYQSVVDNGSNDPIYIPAVGTTDLADSAARIQVVPSVGHFQSWRSDLTIFNPDDGDLRFDLAFHDGSGALRAEAKGLTLPPKALLQLDDVVRSSSLAPRITSDVIGTLRVTVASHLTDRFPVITQRNYSDSGDQRRFGQGIVGFAATEPNVSAGKPAVLPAVRSDARYYSNVGIVNVGSTEASVALKLLHQKSGAVIAVHDVTVRPNESKILQDLIRFLHPAEERGSIQVDVTNGGSVWAFASIIDRVTKDPEYVPAIPLE